MEFGMVGFEGSLVSSSHGLVSLSSDQVANQKWCGSASGFFKQERSEINSHDNDGLRASKMARLGDDLSASKASSPFVFSDLGQNMLSFSSPKLEPFSLKTNCELESRSLHSQTVPSYFLYPSPNASYSKSSGYPCSGGVNVNASMYLLNGAKPFTPSQWLELEHQAMIYKYIIANEPIPPNLLIPITRALESAGFSSFHGGLMRPNSFGWGPFHLGFSNNTDPEPGRCRRTDGKKWRCARDAVPDQKYCERHMNRGRHRSRKPVEGHPGHSVSGVTTNKPTFKSNTNIVNVASPSSASVPPGGSTSSSFAITQNENKDLQPVSRLDFLSPSISLNSSGYTFSIAKEQTPYPESDASSFGGLTSGALSNTTQKNSSLYRSYGSASHDLNSQDSDPQQSLRPFMDEWPKLQTQLDRTQLSISIPAAPADFMSSTSSPTGERVILSPLRLSRALDPVDMGLGVGTMEQSQKQANWVPISWETSIGGPLGEVLKTTSNSSSEDNGKNVSALNLLSKGWEGSPQVASSPTAVLQRTAIGSLSNSSAGSSPQAENGRALKSGSVSVAFGGSSLGNSVALPSHFVAD